MRRYGVFLLSLLLLFPLAIGAQEQPAVNCATVEQCRTLVLVARSQLLTAQDQWAFWAAKVSQLQEEMAKLQKPAKEATDAKSE